MTMKAVLVIIIISLCVICLSQARETRDIVTSYRVYVRQTELKQAELEGRIETLERVGIEIELKQRDGIWLVTHTEEK